MRKKISILVTVILIIVLSLCCVSCSKSSENNYYESPSEETNIKDVGESAGTAPSDRKIIYTVEATLRTDDTTKMLADIRKLVKEDEWEESVNQGTNHAVVVFRIKTTRLDEFMKELSSAGKLENYTKTSKDVTNTYTDIEDQLAVLEAQKAALVALYATASALEETISIQMTINEIDGKIAVLNREKTSLDSRIEYSVVKLFINKNHTYVPSSYKQEVKNDLSQSWMMLGAFFKFLLRAIIYLFPFALVGGAIAGGVVFIVRYKKKNKKTKNIEDNKEDTK